MSARSLRATVRRLGAGAIFFASVAPSSGLSQPAARAKETVPPRIESASEVAYPEGAQGDAEVVLVLVVESSGRVRSVDVEVGAEPFASAARQAAAAFRFAPATRGGAPVAARIRFSVTFRAPLPLAEPAAAVDAGVQPDRDAGQSIADADGVVTLDELSKAPRAPAETGESGEGDGSSGAGSGAQPEDAEGTSGSLGHLMYEELLRRVLRIAGAGPCEAEQRSRR